MSTLLLFDCLDPSFLLFALFLLSNGLRPVFSSFDTFSFDDCSFILLINCDVPSDMFPNTSFMLLILLCEAPVMAPNTDPSPDLLVCTDCLLGILVFYPISIKRLKVYQKTKCQHVNLKGGLCPKTYIYSLTSKGVTHSTHCDSVAKHAGPAACYRIDWVMPLLVESRRVANQNEHLFMDATIDSP